MEDKMAAIAFGRARNYGCDGRFTDNPKTEVQHKQEDGKTKFC